MVAIVNGVRITKEQLRREKDFISLKYKNLDQDSLYKRALRNLIDAAIILQQSEKDGVFVQENEVDEALVSFLSYFSDKENYFSKLKEVEITEAELRERLEMHVRVGKFLAGKFECKDDSCEEKLKIFYETNSELFTTDKKIRLSHILIEGNSEESRACAQELRKEILSPEDFYKYVSFASSCPSSIQNGDLGYLLPGELIPELDEVAFKLKTGEISDVINTEYGHHILLVTEIIPSKLLKFDEVRDFLSDYHKDIMQELNVEKYLNELREKAHIEYIQSDNT